MAYGARPHARADRARGLLGRACIACPQAMWRIAEVDVADTLRRAVHKLLADSSVDAAHRVKRSCLPCAGVRGRGPCHSRVTPARAEGLGVLGRALRATRPEPARDPPILVTVEPDAIIGFALRRTALGAPAVVAAAPSSAAGRAGVRIADELVAVDGEDLCAG